MLVCGSGNEGGAFGGCDCGGEGDGGCIYGDAADVFGGYQW